ncbi:hypothetical protein BDV96DRAFT_610605 [Lophiotrema nucula]|uniref:Uncharacterized protein n=1 Tax=Lophiotrema nucula TaxID=690887 RepID=A0A6A5ZK26_9PLEO|nr:hypothetical protein BDV96DRAFT_610605 [Lophiotrema nucula]
MASEGAAVANKFLSKHRWRAKVFKNEEAAPKEPQQTDEDVNDFLKPSTEKAQEHKQAAVTAFLASSNKPRIDVAKAQRWPGANEIGRSPGIGGLKTGTRKKGLSVSFARDTPAVIGEGGDECEEPSIEVYNRKKSNSLTDLDRLRSNASSDDMNLGLRSPSFHVKGSTNADAQRRGIVTRTTTSAGELSPPLLQKMQMGNINAHAAAPPPPPPPRTGPMGLGERPKVLQRAPTGFDIAEDGTRRPSVESSWSYSTEGTSPVLERRAPSLEPTLEEEEDNFRPQPLKRSQTGWSDQMSNSDEEPPVPIPAVPLLPEMNLHEDNSPLESSLNKHFLESEPADPNSFSARVIHKMRADEGKALQQGTKRDSGSSTNSFQPGSLQSNPFQVRTPPPADFTLQAGRTPPRVPSREPPMSPRNLEPEYDPYRSRARGPSPGRPPMPPGAFPLDTDPRPGSSSSSQYTVPSAASRTRNSPIPPADPFSATTSSSIQQTPSSLEKTPFSAESQNSILPTPPQFEKQGYIEPPQPPQQRVPPPPPTHAQDPGLQVATPYKQDAGLHVASSHRQDPGLQVATPYNQDAGIQVAPNHRQDPGMQVAPSHRQDPGMQAASTLARSDTRSQGEVAFNDFSERVQHMQGIFRLTAELGVQLYDRTPMQWLRVAIWWFLKGRAGMEALIRSQPKGAPPQFERLTQPHVDLAKTWWILTQLLPHHPTLRKYGDQRMETQAKLAGEAGDAMMAEVYEGHDIITSFLKMLLGSMRRHGVMPPTQALIQGQDQKIWEEYPFFTPDVQAVLQGTRMMNANGPPQQINPAMTIPLGDTKADFCYFRFFAKVSVSTEDPNTDRVPLSAVVSVMRPRDDLNVKLSICSQTELINLTVSDKQDSGLTWRDVNWKSKTRGLSIQLRHGYTANIELTEQDFRSLWAIVDHTNRVEAQLHERGDERLTLKIHLRDFSYKDPTNPGAFPQERVKGCRLLLFEKSDRSAEGSGRRRLHRGYRVAIVTNTKNRTLSCISHEMGAVQEPTNFEYATDTDNAPAMILRFKELTSDKRSKVCTAYMAFNDPKDRNKLFGTFTSMNVASDEAVFAQVPLKAFNIESADTAEGFSQSGHDVLKRLQWQEAKAMNQDPEAAGLESAPTVMSESLRIIARHSAGVITDRLNLDTGELLVRLPVDGAAELTFLRNPQQDIAVAIDASRTDKDIPEGLAELLRTLTTASTIRKLTFNSFSDLHAFQLAVTGFEVRFDGIASTFSISRRRMVVPIYKQWTASQIRLQVVVQDNIVQLLAFFQDFSHADAMNFQLRQTDVFEKIDKSGKPGLRLVDAKFALPVEERRGEGKMQKEEGKLTGWSGGRRKFVCLDQIEYPGEHDDIVICFDSMETRDRFAEALPAAIMERKFTVRRKF